MTDTSSAPRLDRPNRWAGPAILLAVVAVVIVVFVASNTAPIKIAFAGLKWESAPGWLVIVVTLVVGAIGSRLLGWVWRAWRRRRRRLAVELDALRKHAEPED